MNYGMALLATIWGVWIGKQMFDIYKDIKKRKQEKRRAEFRKEWEDYFQGKRGCFKK